MSTHKDEKNGTWYVMVRYHDWKGVKRQKCKRGFATRREEQEWERNFQLQTDGDPDMTFEAFMELYENDMRPRLKENTWLSKKHMIRTKLFATFGKKMLSEIETRDIIAWQNELLAYRDEKKQPYSPTYLKSIHNQLVAILNHAVRHYRLKSNPASKVGYIGSKEAEKMQFWTKEEYQRFAEAVMDKPMSYYAFEMLYWCGIREGELLALTPGDFNFKAETVSINKSYQRLHLYHFDPRWKRQNSTSEPQRATGLHHEPGKDGRWDSDLVPRLFPRNCSGGVHAVSSGIPEHYRQKTRG